MYLNRGALPELAAIARHRASPRRVFVWASYAVGVALVRGFLTLTRWIDDVIWPGIAEQRVEPPVFIFGNARSGTTLLHRVMSCDEDHFTTMKLYQSVFPRVCIIETIGALGRLDERVPGRPLHASVRFLNRRVFRAWDGIHEMGLDRAEEDEAIFTLSLITPALVLAFPDLDELESAAFLDDKPEAERQACLDLYDDALRRFLYARGEGRRFLNKSVLFAPRIGSMLERYPEANLVYLVRHPFEAIPSFLNMFHKKWLTHSPEIEADSREVRALARLAIDYYRRSFETCRSFDAKRLVAVRYDELVADPKATVLDIYDRLGIEPGPAFEARLDEILVEQKAYMSSHRYSLEQFGLSEQDIYEELEDVFTEFDFAPPVGESIEARSSVG
ncbi:MAG: sulfotransferase [Actinomycetota bacterium]|nr:sulfotransferase [Actinomycetota bacterium]